MHLIAVHIGAGYHSTSKREQYLRICSNACEAASHILENPDSNAVDGVVEAIRCLEDEVLTNAGLGSNLNLAGYVECDASIMDGQDLLFGSVGALQSIKNPIMVARAVLENQRIKPPMGLIAPNFLAGDGARKFAIANGCEESDLVSEKSFNVYHKYKRQMDDCKMLEPKRQRLDTVGAVCIDRSGYLASGVSSGGLILKKEGRIGQASVPGAGCWTQNGVSVSSSGVGEYLVRTNLARKLAEKFPQQDEDDCDTLQKLVEIFKDDFFGSPLMSNVPQDDHLAGVLGLRQDPKDTGTLELFWAHSTRSMCIGYKTSEQKSTKSFVSELSQETVPGTTVNAQSKIFKWL